MKGLIRTFRSRYKLFKQPKKIGDTIESDGELWLIIGIEKFELIGKILTIWFTCQDLSQSDYHFVKQMGALDASEVELERQAKFDDDDWKYVRPGLTTTAKDGNVYKIIEYTEVSLKSTDLYVSMIAKRVYPIDRKEAKAKFLQERKKKLKLEVH